jgi:hypothetical protein
MSAISHFTYTVSVKWESAGGKTGYGFNTGNYSYNKIYLENIFFKNFIFVGKYHM